MNLLKLTIANGPEKGGSLYLNKDKICGFTPVICRLGPASEYGKEKGSNVLMECHRSYEVEEKVEEICEILGNCIGHLLITGKPNKNEI